MVHLGDYFIACPAMIVILSIFVAYFSLSTWTLECIATTNIITKKEHQVLWVHAGMEMISSLFSCAILACFDIEMNPFLCWCGAWQEDAEQPRAWEPDPSTRTVRLKPTVTTEGLRIECLLQFFGWPSSQHCCHLVVFWALNRQSFPESCLATTQVNIAKKPFEEVVSDCSIRLFCFGLLEAMSELPGHCPGQTLCICHFWSVKLPLKVVWPCWYPRQCLHVRLKTAFETQSSKKAKVCGPCPWVFCLCHVCLRLTCCEKTEWMQYGDLLYYIRILSEYNWKMSPCSQLQFFAKQCGTLRGSYGKSKAS